MTVQNTYPAANGDTELQHMLDTREEKIAIKDKEKNRDDEENNAKQSVLQKKKEQYMQSFTIHGVSRIFEGSKRETAFWMSVVLIGITLTCFGVYKLISKYYEYEIYTALSSHITNTNYFPSITFCDEKLMLNNYFTYCAGDNSSPNLPCNYFPKDAPEVKNILNSTTEWSNGIFHVKACSTWGNKYCTDDKHLKSLKRHNHYCFTWNYNGQLFDPYGHVKIEFEFNKSSNVNKTAIFASVHDPRISELEIMRRVFMTPSNNYELNIQKTVTHRLPPPFPSKCTHGKPHDVFPGKYTRATCLDSINYVEMLKHCGDIFDYVKKRIPKKLLRESKLKRNLSKIETKKCMFTYSRKTVNSIENCPVPCEELEYVTMSTFHTLGKRQENLYEVDIQLQHIDSYKVITEKQVFTWDQLAGGVGGFLGLIIGASLVSVIEILVYVLLCLFEKCFK